MVSRHHKLFHPYSILSPNIVPPLQYLVTINCSTPKYLVTIICSTPIVYRHQILFDPQCFSSPNIVLPPNIVQHLVTKYRSRCETQLTKAASIQICFSSDVNCFKKQQYLCKQNGGRTLTDFIWCISVSEDSDFVCVLCMYTV